MTHDQFELQEPPPRPQGSGRLVVAGVLGACVLGVGLGLWARPGGTDGLAGREAAQPAPVRTPSLQIVVDDTPAPLGRPLVVLPADLASDTPARAPLGPEFLAPTRAVSGLVKVDAPVAADVPAPLAAKPVAAPRPAPAPAVRRIEAVVRTPTPEAVRPGKVKTVKARKAEAPRRDVAKTEKATVEKARVPKVKVEKVRIQKAKAEKVRPAKVQVAKAKAEAAKVVAARRETARIAEAKAVRARAEKAQSVKLAAARKAKAVRLARMDSKVGTKRAKAESTAKPVRMARAKADPKPKVQARPVVRTAAARPAKKVAPRGEGPIRVARANPCANADPGEALVCADGRLGARDRQLQRAYRDAEAAGVPASALRRQQSRWLQARAAAAREAPWAVEDVYEARISELNDLSRDARENE